MAVSLATLTAQGAAPFTAALRRPGGTFVITRDWEIFQITTGNNLTKIAALRDMTGRSHQWTRIPLSFVHWKTDWLVADATNEITRFRADGSFAGFVKTPFYAGTLAIVGQTLWGLNALATNPSDQLWRSTDGETFTAYSAPAKKEHFDSPLQNMLLLAGNRAGQLYTASVIGPPILHRLLPAEMRRDIMLGYSRSKLRASRTSPIGLLEDTGYSLPVRDIVALDTGFLVALRNREDVATAAHTSGLWLGRRADHYDASGRQIATAAFPSSVHWIVAVTALDVTGINRDGTFATAKWGRPLPSVVLP